MKQKNLDFIKNELQTLITLIPIWIILERTLRTGGLDFKLIIYFTVTSLIIFFTIWFLINWKRKIIKYLNISGVIVCILGLILWIFFPEFIGIYLLSIGIILVSMLLEARILKGINNEKKYTWQGVLYFQIISFIGFSLSFIIAVYFWDNLILFLIIILEIISILLGFFINSKNSNKMIINYEKLLPYIPQTGILEIFIPIGSSVLLYFLIRGSIVFIPIDFNSGKLLAAAFLAIISFVLSIIYIKVK